MNLNIDQTPTRKRTYLPVGEWRVEGTDTSGVEWRSRGIPDGKTARQVAFNNAYSQHTEFTVTRKGKPVVRYRWNFGSKMVVCEDVE